MGSYLNQINKYACLLSLYTLKNDSVVLWTWASANNTTLCCLLKHDSEKSVVALKMHERYITLIIQFIKAAK